MRTGIGRMIAAVTCCLLVAASIFLSPSEPTAGAFSPMFLRGQPVWVTRISRRQLKLNVAERDARPRQEPETEVAVILL